MIEKQLVVGPFQCNCRIFACPKTGLALVVDPGDEPLEIIQTIQQMKLQDGRPIQVQWLLHTHAHLDHIGGTRKLKESIPEARIALHSADRFIYDRLQEQGRIFNMNYDEPLPVEFDLEHEQELRVGELKLTVIHTPGHSPGSICLRLHEDSSIGATERVLTGDTLFYQSVGRTDLWGGDAEQMFKSIHERILTLDGDTRVCPGHGPDSWIGDEKKRNPFLVR
jgi:glyoxylase-like metal-dependent hydrolase (beta-lactamase superfamily II)